MGISQPARDEIKKFAEGTFAVASEGILLRWGGPGRYAQNKVTQTGNAGSYLPGLIEWASGRVRELILALSEAWVKSFWRYQRSADREAEQDLKRSAQQMTAGTISAVRGHLRLSATRTLKNSNSGGRFHLEIERAMNSAFKEGTLKLRAQRVEFRSKSRIPEDEIFAVLRESGVEPNRATFEQFYKALEVYRKRFPEFERIGVRGDRWAVIQRAQLANWENDALQHRSQIKKNRGIITLAWHEGKKRASNPEKWRGYRDEFGRLRIDEQGSSLSRTPEKRLWAGGDFATGFSAISDDKRIAAHFEEIAARAASDLGCPNEFDPSSFWQACLFVHLNETGKREIFISGKDGEEGGCVREPLEASEEVSSLLAREALKNAGETIKADSLPSPRKEEDASNSSGKPNRRSASVKSPAAVRRMDKYLDEHPELTPTDFAIAAETTDRTLRRFRESCRAKREVLRGIASAMKIDLAALVRPD